MAMADQQSTEPEQMHPAKKVVLDHLVNIYRAARSVSGQGLDANFFDGLQSSTIAIEKFINENFTEPEKESAPEDASEHPEQ